MNITDIEKFGKERGVDIAKIIVVLQDDSRTIILSPKMVIRQLIQQSVERDGLGKLYIFDKLSSEWLKDDPPNLPFHFSSELNT
jgi:hypothetical protein